MVEVAVKDKAVIHDLAATLPQQAGGRLVSVLDHVFGGFVAEMPEASAIQLSRHPGIAAVHEVPAGRPVTIEPAASAGLDRIDQRALPLDGQYSYTYTGTGVTVYIIDTGVDVVGDLIGRVAAHHDLTSYGPYDCRQGSGGHGTQVASTVGGSTYGVARDVRLVNVKAYGCLGNTVGADVPATALNWIVKNRPAGELSVANISLQYPIHTPLDEAVRDAVMNGVTVVVAAGNSNADACNSSPSRAGNPASIPNNPNGYSAITVAASDNNDHLAWWAEGVSSNSGACVDIFAPGGPGLTAQGTRWGTAEVDNAWDGTSAASPHVAGIAALTLHKYGDITPGMVENNIIENSTTGVITNNPNGKTTWLEGTPNRLVYQVPAPRRRICCSY